MNTEDALELIRTVLQLDLSLCILYYRHARLLRVLNKNIL